MEGKVNDDTSIRSSEVGFDEGTAREQNHVHSVSMAGLWQFQVLQQWFGTAFTLVQIAQGQQAP